MALEITQDNLILEEIEESSQKTTYKTYYLYLNDKEIRVLNNYCYDEDGLIVFDEWIYETNLVLTDEDKKAIKSFCEEQDIT